MSPSNEEPPSEPSTCTNCHGPTTRRCMGCLGAPDYDAPSPNTFYCSAKCQKGNWRRHKQDCQKLQARKRLHRAALLLQAIIYKIRMHTSTLPIASVHKEGTIIHLKGSVANPLFGMRMKPFPVHLCKEQDVLQSALVYQACMEAMVFLQRFIWELLEDLCSEIKELNVTISKIELQIHYDSVVGPISGTPQSMYHNVYRVVSKHGEIWAIDPTGAQFGYYEPLTPWKIFEQRTSKVDRVTELGYIRNKVFYNSAKYPLAHMVLRQAEQEELVKAVEDWLLVWTRQHHGGLGVVLREPDRTFESTKHGFLEQLESHVQGSLEELYSPTRVAERTERVNARVAQNQADPANGAEFNRYLNFFANAMGGGSS